MQLILKICFISQFKNSNFMTFSDKLKVPPLIIYRSSVAISMEQVDELIDVRKKQKSAYNIYYESDYSFLLLISF
jgi:hypothetical protein